MSEPIRLVCPECDAVHRVKQVTLGKLYRCKKCKAGLITLAPAVLRCPHCRAETAPSHVEVSRLITCDQCQETPLLQVVFPATTPPPREIAATAERVEEQAPESHTAPPETSATEPEENTEKASQQPSSPPPIPEKAPDSQPHSQPEPQPHLRLVKREEERPAAPPRPEKPLFAPDEPERETVFTPPPKSPGKQTLRDRATDKPERQSLDLPGSSPDDVEAEKPFDQPPPGPQRSAAHLPAAAPVHEERAVAALRNIFRDLQAPLVREINRGRWTAPLWVIGVILLLASVAVGALYGLYVDMRRELTDHRHDLEEVRTERDRYEEDLKNLHADFRKQQQKWLRTLDDYYFKLKSAEDRERDRREKLETLSRKLEQTERVARKYKQELERR